MAKFAIAGGYLIDGAFIPHSHRDMARTGKAKNLTDPAIVAGQKRQTKPSHEFLHGAPLDDEPNAKLSVGKQVAIAAGMKSQTGNGLDVLRKASDLMCHDNADDKCKALPSAMKR